MKLARDLNPESSWVVGHNGRPDDENAAAALINFVALAAGASDRSLVPWYLRCVDFRAGDDDLKNVLATPVVGAVGRLVL